MKRLSGREAQPSLDPDSEMNVVKDLPLTKEQDTAAIDGENIYPPHSFTLALWSTGVRT